jgi:hypothetical protein
LFDYICQRRLDGALRRPAPHSFDDTVALLERACSSAM